MICSFLQVVRYGIVEGTEMTGSWNITVHFLASKALEGLFFLSVCLCVQLYTHFLTGKQCLWIESMHGFISDGIPSLILHRMFVSPFSAHTVFSV